MEWIDLNSEKDIGSNAYYLRCGKFHLVLDSGLHPKKWGSEALPRFEKIPVEHIDFLFLSHCHLDHIGSVPCFYKKFPRTKIILTRASVAIARHMMKDSYNVMLKQKEEKDLVDYPLFSSGEIDSAKKAFYGVDFEKKYLFKKGQEELEFVFFKAGHIPGAAGIQITHGGKSLFFTGDVLFRNQNILPGARFPKTPVDTLVLETTKGRSEGNKPRFVEHETRRLLGMLRKTLAQGGSCLIPAFALGRMQEILSLLNRAYLDKKLPKCPIYSTGLGVRLAGTFEELSRRGGWANFSMEVFKSLGVKTLRANQLKPGKGPKEPSIYVVSSGMLLENTPAYRVAAALLGEPKNAICFVGYCDQDAPGGQLLKAKSQSLFNFEAFNHKVAIRAKVLQFDFSAHAEREELLEFAQAKTPKTVILSHGGVESRQWFLKQLPKVLPKSRILDPELGVAYSI